jgi:pimeloyl-ACP methyl ester carboxylesterase
MTVGIGAALLGAVFAACGEGDGPSASATPTRMPSPKPEGARMVDIGGYALEIRCSGQGAPTVVFESGALPFIDVFEDFKRTVSGEWRACSYDRAGTGKSEAGPEPRTAPAIAAELRRLLDAAGEQGPFVFVSWSAGAQYTLAYGAAYPDDVAGIALVEPRLPAYQLAMPSPFAGAEQQELLGRLPAPYRLEIEAWGDNARAIQDIELPDVPVIVLTAGSAEAMAALAPPGDDYALWARTHEELAASVPRGRHVVVEDAEHRVWERNPVAVLEAIRWAVGQ